MSNENGTWIMHGVDEDDPYCLRTVEQLEAYINEIGFLPLFKNDIPGFSVEERTVPHYWWSGDAARDPWEWRAIIAERGEIAYGKFFDRKAGFISRKWMPTFANWRRDGYDFDARWDDEKAQARQKKIMDLFMEGAEAEACGAGPQGRAEGPAGAPDGARGADAPENAACLFSNDIKRRAGFGKDGEKNFEGVMTELQMETYLCVRRFKRRLNKSGDEYGWPVAVYTMPENLWGAAHIAAGYKEEPEVSRERIYEYLRDVYPIATEKMIKKVIG